MESDQPASAKKRTALGYAWEGTLASFGANGWHVLVTAAAIAGLTGIISWYRKGDAAEGVAQMFTLTSALAASGLIFAALFVFHFGRGLLKVQIDQKDDQIRSLNAKLQAIEPIRQENAGLTAQVAKLTDKHPQLRLHFRDNDDGFFCQGWFFVKVMNESHVSSAHGTIVSVTRISHFGKSDESLTIRLSNGQPVPWLLGTTQQDLTPSPDVPGHFPQPTRFDLNPTECRTVALARYIPETSEIRLGAFGGTTQGLRIPKGAYSVRLQASGQNSLTDEINLVIGVNDDGKLICEIDKSHLPISRQVHGAKAGVPQPVQARDLKNVPSPHAAS